MKDVSKLRLHPTKSGGVSGPVIGRLSNKAVLQLGVSLLVGLMVSVIFKSLFIGGAVPLVTFVFLLALSGKPEGFAFHWMEWQWIKRRGASLFEWEFSENEYDES